MNYIIRYILLFSTNLISNENLIEIENKDTFCLIEILQNDMLQMEANLNILKLSFLISELIFVGSSTCCFVEFDNQKRTIEAGVAFYSSIILMYCAIYDFSNYTYFFLLLNPATIDGLRKRNISYILLGVIFLLPNYIKSWIHKKTIDFKKLQNLKIKQIEDLLNDKPKELQFNHSSK